MFELPLFPLKTVLFPGTPLTLHIFEERYKQMMNRCIEDRTPFGVVLIEEGEAQNEALASPYLVGCTATIQQVQPLPEGRMNMLAVGRERFKIVELQRDLPYLVGKVESFPLPEGGADVMARESEVLRPMVLSYLEILGRIGEVDLDNTELPEDPLKMGYLAAALLRVSMEKKQQLLDSSSAPRMLRTMRYFYREELEVLQHIPGENQGPFSLN